MPTFIAVDPSQAPKITGALIVRRHLFHPCHEPAFELVCPAGGLPALKTAVDHGANCVYTGFSDETNARNFTGLNFDDASLKAGIAYAHQRGVKVLIALNTYPQSDNWSTLDRRRGQRRRPSASMP